MTSGLWLSQLKLSHFRSHKHLTLDLDPKPVAIFGANGAGKTNILEAVSFLSPGRGLRRAVVADVARKPELLGWKLNAQLWSNGTEHSIETGVEGGGTRSVRLNGKAIPQTILGKTCPIVWLVPNMDRLWTEGAEGRRRFLDRLCLSFFPAHAECALAYEKAMRDRNRLLKEQVSDPSWYRALEHQMAQAGAEITTHRLKTLARLAKMTDISASVFPKCGLSLVTASGERAEDLTPEHLADALNDNRFKDMAAGRSLVGPHRHDMRGRYLAKDLAAQDCSTGEQKALLLSVVLAHARALKQDHGTAPILLLDEVAAHLDSDRCAALFAELIELGTQAWMTGTGPELFSALGTQAQYLHVAETNGLSQLVDMP